MGHVMSATKPKTKDVNTKQTKGPHWPRLEWGLFIVFVELIGLELSSITPKKQIIRSFLKIWEGKSSPCCHRACACAQFSESLALGERLTPFPWVFLPVSFKTAKNKQTNPSSEGKLRKAQWMWIFPLKFEDSVDRSSLYSAGWTSASDGEKELEAAPPERVEPAWRHLPAFPVLPPLTPPGHTRMRCQVKYKQSSDWIIIYSVLNLN